MLIPISPPPDSIFALLSRTTTAQNVLHDQHVHRMLPGDAVAQDLRFEGTSYRSDQNIYSL